MPLRNTVLFPQQVIPIYVGREKSLKLIEDLEPDNKYLVVVAQQDGSIEDPKQEDLYSYGTLALVLKVFDMPDNSKSAIVQGVDRVKILKYQESDSYFLADVERIPESITSPDVEIEALAKSLKSSFTELIKISPNLNEEHAGMLSNIDRPSRLADRATSLLSVSNSEKQEVLEELDIKKRVENAINLLQREIQRIKLGEEIQTEVQDEISKTQREYYLREQMKTIQKELGEDNQTVELDELKAKIADAKMTAEAEKNC
jgi:ATP-dependent Lon protease